MLYALGIRRVHRVQVYHHHSEKAKAALSRLDGLEVVWVGFDVEQNLVELLDASVE